MHRAHPLAGDELFQIGALEHVAAVRIERVDRAHGQKRADAESHAGAVPHFGTGGIDDLRQCLPAPFGGRSKPVPAALAPCVIGFSPARRGGDDAVLDGGADAIAGTVERRKHFGRHAAGFGQHRLDIVHAQVAEESFFQCRQQRSPVLERKAHIGEGRMVGQAVSARMCKGHMRRRQPGTYSILSGTYSIL